jgi:hypothetical protein
MAALRQPGGLCNVHQVLFVILFVLLIRLMVWIMLTTCVGQGGGRLWLLP